MQITLPGQQETTQTNFLGKTINEVTVLTQDQTFLIGGKSLTNLVQSGIKLAGVDVSLAQK